MGVPAMDQSVLFRETAMVPWLGELISLVKVMLIVLMITWRNSFMITA
jgi:hypothetical protein